jgi:hypothetical protein
LGAFESDFGFTLRERKSLTLDQLQVDALEVEENFTSQGSQEESKNLLRIKEGKKRHPPLVKIENHQT